jgi:DNA-binding response OmpR family regulator
MSLGKVLVVDDEPDVRQLLYDFLSSRDYEVVLAATGLDAIDHVQRERPDLVLLDVAMPGLDGVATLERIAAIDSSVRVIMVTANADIGLTSRLLAMGAVDYIPKPFDLEYLEQAVSIQLTASQDR